MFFKPRDYKSMSDADWKWCRQVTRENCLSMVVDAIDQKKSQCLRFLVNSKPAENLKRAHFVALAEKAMRAGHLDMLGYVVSNSNFSMFMVSTTGMSPVFHAAAQTKNDEGWNYLVQHNQRFPDRSRQSLEMIADIAAEEGYIAGLHSLTGIYVTSKIAGTALQKGSFDTFRAFMQDLAGEGMANKALLDELLVSAVTQGKAEAVNFLVKSGANIHFREGAVLATALVEGHTDIAQLLVDQGFRLDLYGRTVLQEMVAKNARVEAISFLEGVLEGSPFRTAPVLPMPRGRAAAEPEGKYVLAAADTLAETQQMPTGGTLTILFNFATRQQMIIAPSAPATVIPFADIDADVLGKICKRMEGIGGDTCGFTPACTKASIDRSKTGFFPKGCA